MVEPRDGPGINQHFSGRNGPISLNQIVSRSSGFYSNALIFCDAELAALNVSTALLPTMKLGHVDSVFSVTYSWIVIFSQKHSA